MKKTVFITGVSSGLGKYMALKFMREGFEVAGISRTEPDFKLDFWMKADVTSDSDRKLVLAEFRKKFKTLDLLINNAGKGIYEKWENTSEAELRDIFELNVFALAAVTNLFLPLLKESKGTIINISSIAGVVYVPCMGPYCATKYAVNAYSDTLRVELYSSGVHVMNVMPGRISTGFSDRALGKMRPPSTPGRSAPELFAEKLFSGYQKKRRQMIFPGWYFLLIWLMKLFTGFYEKQNMKKWNL